MLGMQDAIIDRIKEIGDVSVERYWGELSNPQDPQLPDGKLPLVLVDYIGDTPKSVTNMNYNFNLYIVHVGLSKNADTRKKKNEEVLLLLKLVDKQISLATINGGIAKLGTSKKIFDARSRKGYLTIYLRKVSIERGIDYHLGRIDGIL